MPGWLALREVRQSSRIARCNMTSLQVQTCLLSTLCALTVLPARGAVNQILFTGAVVEPTCIVSDSDLIHVAWSKSPSSRHSRTRFACDETNTTIATQYSVSVVSVAAARSGINPLLDYFASRLDAIGISQAHAKVITATYE